MKYSISQDVFTGRYETILLGGEFANLHGSGDTEEAAVISLKLALRAKRKQRWLDGHQNKKRPK
jgi:hypothetical protein